MWVLAHIQQHPPFSTTSRKASWRRRARGCRDGGAVAAMVSRFFFGGDVWERKTKTKKQYSPSSASRTTNLASVASSHPTPSRGRGRCSPEGRDCAQGRSTGGGKGERGVSCACFFLGNQLIDSFFVWANPIRGGNSAFVRRKDREKSMFLRHFGMFL